MLEIQRFDVRTGLPLFDHAALDERVPQIKTAEHCYLEQWLGDREANLYVARFYDGVQPEDRERLEAQGKHLVWTNGKDGYFTDRETAELLRAGDPSRGIAPLYAADQHSAHNLVAYGSLVASDGMASTVVPEARILVIDDAQRNPGDAPVVDAQGQPLSQDRLDRLLDKMGDGTMLVSSKLMQHLIQEDERDAITAAVFKKAGIEATDVSTLAQEVEALPSASEEIERRLESLAHRTVTQFRAATPDYPGMMKGTLGSSRWCEVLGVDAIVSTNDIKGDDGRLSSPGLHTVKDFWVNRKSDAAYGLQAVGPQVKGCIPDATLHEFNPRMEAQAQELASVASDPQKLLALYVKKKEAQHGRTPTDEHGDGDGALTSKPQSDWLYQIATSDRYAQLTRNSKVNRELARFLKGEWKDSALHGIHIPSAMAQHHAALEPWEVCNKDLPHGAIVAYYRSPFPNVGAAAIAINNTDILRQTDREALAKEGVAYLPPWTAKHIAITDFDRDNNAYFVGYTAQVPDLPAQIRQQLAPTQGRSDAEKYKAGRSLFETLIHQAEAGQEQRIAPADYPHAVTEFIERNAPEKRPPDIEKAPKVKHSWAQENEPHAAAVWRAWSVTADNPTGMVANAGMTLQSLALELQYAPKDQKVVLLNQVAKNCSQVLGRAAKGQLFIPDDAWLKSNGEYAFPAYHFKEDLARLALAPQQLQRIQDPAQRETFVDNRLQQAARMYWNAVDGPNAVNLQTAVDTAKSSRGIMPEIQEFVQALAHKKHELRRHYKDPDIFMGQKALPTNTQEPIGWGVEAVNREYEATRLPELPNEAFFSLIPKDPSLTAAEESAAKTIGHTYNQWIHDQAQARARLQRKEPADQQPTATLIFQSGRSLTMQYPDPEGTFPELWKTVENPRPDWQLSITTSKTTSHEDQRFPVHVNAADGSARLLGFVAPDSAEHIDLSGFIARQPDGVLRVSPTLVNLHPPYAQQNDAEVMLQSAMDYGETAMAEIPEDRRDAYLSAMWHDSHAMKFALKYFPDAIAQRLETVPEITLRGLQHPTNEASLIPPGDYTVRFSEFAYPTKDGQPKTCESIAIVQDDGTEKQFGSIDNRSFHLPLGTTVHAHIGEIQTNAKNGTKFVTMQVVAPVADAEEHRDTAPPQNSDNSKRYSDTPQRIAPSLVTESTSAYRANTLTIHVNGACCAATHQGGWGAVLQTGEDIKEVGGHRPDQSSNQIQMVAGIEALKYAKAEGLVGADTAVTVVSNSQVFVNGAAGHWQRKANPELWAEYDQAAEDMDVTLQWSRSGRENDLQTRAHAIATDLAQSSSDRSLPTYHSAVAGGRELATAAIKGKPVTMDFPLHLEGSYNPLPVESCIEAMRGYGRSHTTRTFEPYATYGFQKGDIAIAQGQGRQVAFEVGEQYRITPQMMTDPTYQQQWAAMEKHGPDLLPQMFAAKSEVWGLHMKPLGDYEQGTIQPFPDRCGEIYAPSSQELRQWYAIARVQGDESLQGKVLEVGNQLKTLYGNETHQPGARPPADYQNGLVVISEGDRHQMHVGISRMKEAIQASEQSQSQGSATQKPLAQVEAG